MALILEDLKKADSRCYGELAKWWALGPGDPCKLQEQLPISSMAPQTPHKHCSLHLPLQSAWHGRSSWEATEIRRGIPQKGVGAEP